MLKEKNFYLYWNLILLISIFLNNSIKCQNTYNCPEGFKAKDANFCPTIITCDEDKGLIRINLYTCAYNNIFATPSKCKTGLECWNGICVDSEEEIMSLCPSYTSCPSKEISIKCPDNTCVEKKADCPDYIECPSFNPIRCGNGDCRKNLEDCPSFVHCPETRPILCNDGSCRSQKSDCKVPSEETSCDDKSMTRCSDGTCTNSKFLCPTLSTCPVGYEKCWTGKCKLRGTCFEEDDDAQVLENRICEKSTGILCQFDFSCATDIDSCPTGIICPIDKPVKCWDNSCRDSVENCPAFQNCPSGLTNCPDGSCGLGNCGTHITCSVNAPYRCFDNTCRRNPEDCPPQPSCPSETPILCWDGRCLAERGECLSPSYCERLHPVKCPNGLCSKSGSNCIEENDCPSEFIRCKDGTCRKKLAYCPIEACPVNLPYQCKNGLCVSDEKYCDNDNGCPFNLPKKCIDGSCVSNEKECPKKDEVECDLNEKQLCPDGSCLNKSEICPSINGCPVDTPYRCANGECINLKKTSCSIPLCDISIPIKCFDGTCVSTINYCPVERKMTESGNVICADGTEAPSYDECKPLVPCGERNERCGDGTCRVKGMGLCPLANTCPKGEVRCENGSCAKSQRLCPTENGCIKETPNRCPGSGFCVENLEECEDIESKFNEANGCPQDKPKKCPKINRCVADIEECQEPQSACSSGEVMCDDGFCTPDLTVCNERSFNCGDDNTGRNVSCFNDPDPCAESLGKCYNSMNCQVDNPFRCGNGDCKRYPSKSMGSDGCDIGVSCPNYKPYLCADGSCAEKSSFCKSYLGCSNDKPYLCTDKTCAKSREECEIYHEKCPAKNPVLCPNGNCGAGIYDCDESKCPSWYPFYCILGECSMAPRDCQKINFTQIDEENNLWDKLIGSVCNENEYVCIDGSCRKSFDQCPIYPGCVLSNKPFKCLDGGCAANKESCKEANNKTLFTCPDDTKLCEDGICRKNCSFVEFNGCSNENPLLCSNGRCVSQIIECVGESACDSTEKPFRCIDGTCGTSLSDCKVPFREVGATNVIISIFPKMEMKSDLIIGPNNILSGSVEIPAGTITNTADGASAETQINFRSVSRNLIVDTYTTYDKTRVDDLKSIFPYADDDNNYKLTYQYTVLSSVIEIKLKDPEKTQISGKILLTLLFDFPYKHEKLAKNYDKVTEEEYSKSTRYTSFPLNYNKDVCLAKLNEKTRKWECNKMNFNVEAKSNLQLIGELNEEGIYAVVLELEMNDNKLYINDNWLISHLKLLTIIFLILLLLIGIGIYIFSRIYRYRMKYKDTKEVYKGFELELSDLQDKSVTGRQGQTYGDIKEGIIYTDNIAFKSQIDNEARKKNTQLEKIFDAYTKKLRLLERNNAVLKGQYDSIKNEYTRLNNYKDTLNEGDQVKIQMNIKEPENTNVGAINDDDDDE